MNRPMRLLSGLVLLALFVVPANIFSCSNLVENRFVSKRMPEVPQQSYINGKLGLLWPTFERRYLAIAYRYLDGKPLSASERDSLIKGTTPILIPGGMAPPDTPVALWLKARSRALGLKDVQQIEIQTWKMNGFNGYPNCGDDTFTKAAATVADRAQKFGVGSAAIQDWVSAQDAVFLNCGSADELRWHPPDQPPPPKVLHEPPPATLNSALLKFDRQYQVAAANFYYGDFATAAGGFEAIAREPESPWRTLAPYLVARSYIRKATLNTTGDQTFDSGAMHEAEKQLQAILADKSLASVHSAAQSLLDYVEARLYPEQRLHALALVLDAGVGDRMNTKLFDYTYLLDHVRDQLSQTESVQQAIREHTRNPADDFEGAALVEGWRSAARKAGDFDDLTDWVQTFQLDTAVSKEYRYERWQATKSLPWLLSALVSAHSDDTLAADIATAAASIAPDSPAYDTALYHRVRLLLEQDRHDPARKLLDANLQRIEALPPADRNPFLAQRFALAQNFQEFLRFAPRTPVELEDYIGKVSVYCDNRSCNNRFGQTTTPPPPRLQLDSVTVFNQDLPLSMLVQAASGTTLPPDLRRELAARTWLRAAILDETSVTRQLGPAVVEAYPEFRPYIEAYDQADSPAARKFAVIYMLLHFSGLQPFVNSGALGSVIRPGIGSYQSWWCYDVGSMQEHRPYQNYIWSAAGSAPSTTVEVGAGEHPTAPPAWIPKPDLAEGQKQAARIAAIGAAPLYFAPVVLDWAKAHPDDPRVPESLHYFVRSTRYGCVDKSIGPYSRRAFNLLHNKYPNSEWTKKTPYWYG